MHSSPAAASETLPLPPPRTHLRRLAVLMPGVALAAAVLALSLAVLAGGRHTLLDWLLLVPFVLVMGWECLLVFQLVLGFTAWLRGRRARSVLERRALALEPVATGKSRTALLIPVFEEDAEAVFSGVRVMLRSLARTGSTDDVDIHVLSDTRTAAVAADERRAFEALGAEAGRRVHYRRRPENKGRKAGNIADFLDRQGDGYDHAVVLDADSLMSGDAIRRLIRLMEENPRVGLIQTVSYATNRDTLFARVQQFAVRLYAPLALRGLAIWQGPEGVYWGHNAILRIAPFRDHCRLPVLPGKPPLGGEILCHDVVEGALLTRAGWEIHLLPDLEGTWEEMPTNTFDLMGRERRWCQGNLQHMRVLGLPGLSAGSRAHILLGIGGYFTAPLWWAFILLGAVRVLTGPVDGGLGLLAYGLTEPGLAGTVLFGLAATVTYLPRLLALLRAFADRRARRGFGGGERLLASVALEQVFWLLLNPMLSLVNTGFVLRILMGKAIRWDPQSRADRHIGLGAAFRGHLPHVGLGALIGAAAVSTGGWYGIWMATTAAGLLLSPVMTSLSSRLDVGVASRRAGLFLTVDDTAPAPELIELRAGAVAGHG